jgi:hypothetical protein
MAKISSPQAFMPAEVLNCADFLCGEKISSLLALTFGRDGR